jgi:hypothetical protein
MRKRNFVESSRRNGCRSTRLGEALLSEDKVSETEPYLSTQTLSMQTRPRTIRRSASLPGDWRKQIGPSVRVVGLVESLRKQRNCPGKANRA